MKFWKLSEAESSNLDLFEGFFFSAYIKTTILPQTNNNLHCGHDQLQYGEFLQWLGLWLLMSTMVGPQRHEYWAAYAINTFRGVPLCLGAMANKSHRSFPPIVELKNNSLHDTVSVVVHLLFLVHPLLSKSFHLITRISMTTWMNWMM